MMEMGQVAQDHCCAICLAVYYQPIKLKKCKHIFCRLCIEEATQLADHKVCPLCRKAFRPQDLEDEMLFGEELKKLYPNQLKHKLANMKQRIVYKLEIGNTTQIVENKSINKNLWELFIEPAQGQKQLKQYIRDIEVELHPTFNPSKITFNPSKPVTLRRWGWGTFTIDIKINWKQQYGGYTELSHDLEFKPRVSKVYTCKLNPK